MEILFNSTNSIRIIPATVPYRNPIHQPYPHDDPSANVEQRAKLLRNLPPRLRWPSLLSSCCRRRRHTLVLTKEPLRPNTNILPAGLTALMVIMPRVNNSIPCPARPVVGGAALRMRV